MSWDEVREALRFEDGRLWLLIALCLALVGTIQAVERSVEGAWPHQLRPAQGAPRARGVRSVWASVALLLLPGMLLGILNLTVLLWREVPSTDAMRLGGGFVALGWLIFVLVSVDLFRFGRYMGTVGPVGPAAMLAVLLVGDALLLIALLDVLPSLETVRDALPVVS